MTRLRVMITLFAALFLAIPAISHAQSAPAPTHFVISGSATGFTGANGTSAASIAGAAIQLTPHISAGYLQVTVPAISARFQMGVVNYTKPLNEWLGTTISNKLVFNISNINLTVQAGGGKLLQPIVNRIAETAGVYVSYPVSNNVSLQLVGVSVLHGGAQTGFVTTNTTTALSTGINFSF